MVELGSVACCKHNILTPCSLQRNIEQSTDGIDIDVRFLVEGKFIKEDSVEL